MEWIPIEKQLPKINTRVIALCLNQERIVISRLSKFDDNSHCWFDDDESTWNFESVTHWMNLPERPKK